MVIVYIGLTGFALTRYNTFYVFYPIGISSECTLIFQALGPAGELSPLFRYLLIAILVIYVPGMFFCSVHSISY
jgi:very-long-chain (3R)-3-hydroxyacyl-CoA dehydratase